MTSNSTPDPAMMQLQWSPPKILLRILGTHMNGRTEVIDFDFWIDCSKDSRLSSGEFVTSSKKDCRSWSKSESSSDFATTSSEWLRDWLGDRRGILRKLTDNTFCLCLGKRNTKRWAIQKLVATSDTDLAEIKRHVQDVADRARYGGKVKVRIQTEEQEKAVTGENGVIIRATWSPRPPWTPSDTPEPPLPRTTSTEPPPLPPTTPTIIATPTINNSYPSIRATTEKTWHEVLIFAILYFKKGLLSFDDPLPRFGQSPLRRAHTLCVVPTTSFEDGLRDGIDMSSLISPTWGSDVHIND